MTPAPDFTLRDQDGEKVSLADFRGRKVLLVFYPVRLQPGLRRPALDLPGGQAGDRREGRRAGRDQRRPASSRTRPSRRSSGFDTTLLADFEPKGEVARAYGSYLDGLGFANRTLVLVDEEGTVAWTYESPNPGEFPGANVIFDALA